MFDEISENKILDDDIWFTDGASKVEHFYDDHRALKKNGVNALGVTLFLLLLSLTLPSSYSKMLKFLLLKIILWDLATLSIRLP